MLNKERIKKIFKVRFLQGILLSVIVVAFCFVFSLYNAKPLSISFSEISLRKLINSEGVMAKLGQVFVSISQNIFDMSNSDSSLFLFSVIGMALVLIIFFILMTLLHDLIFNFSFFGFGKKGVTRIALEWFLVFLILSVPLGLITGIPIHAVWVVFLIYYSLSILTFIALFKLGIISIKEVTEFR